MTTITTVEEALDWVAAGGGLADPAGVVPVSRIRQA